MRVFVGLSGGVDSAVSAALLKREGHDVTGVFIKIWSPEFLECTWKEDRLDAMRVCAALEIPFREIDLSAEYKREVVDPMVADYSRGVTPNPDVLCNRSIKFGAFLAWARECGADGIATGHYAQCIALSRQGLDSQGLALTYRLLRGADAGKDQSYFLYRMGQQELRYTLFPVGGYAKAQVRELARQYDIPVARKPDSQGLCFVGAVSMHDFLARFIPLQKGSVIDEGGKMIGEHDGAALYTLGQRHGFTTNVAGPLYATNVDTRTNTLHVSRDRGAAACTEAFVDDVHWIGSAPRMPLSAQVQTRYRERPASAIIEASERGMHVRFNEPHIASPGQSLVIYDDQVCLGGGVIQSF